MLTVSALAAEDGGSRVITAAKKRNSRKFGSFFRGFVVGTSFRNDVTVAYVSGYSYIHSTRFVPDCPDIIWTKIIGI